ncbi:MAG: DUF3810 domain-containing protein [Lachnospiraceae bacterium]|jgi:hypothetical protein|nr:DUF3810 domain-containing protein [Lachnospiraceae bacterium]
MPEKRALRLLPWCFLLGLSLALHLLARLWPGFAEWYAIHVYPVFVGTLGRLCSLVPVSVIELLLYGGVALALAGLVAVAVKRLSLKRALWILGRTLIAVFFLFTLNCGINYQRLPFSERAGFVIQESTEEELIVLCERLVEEINAAAEEIALDEEGYCTLTEDPAKTAREAMAAAALEYPELGGYYPKAKPVLTTWYLSSQLLQGVYSPFTVEANYNNGMPEQDKPSTICHELSHLKGFMREDEANFVAYLACRASEDPQFRYSGSTLAYIYSGNALYAQNPAALRKVREKLCDQAVRDLLDHNAYWDTYRGKISEVSDKVNDVYLKANAQEAGTKSYGRMVDLLLAWNREQEQKAAEPE